MERALLVKLHLDRLALSPPSLWLLMLLLLALAARFMSARCRLANAEPPLAAADSEFDSGECHANSSRWEGSRSPVCVYGQTDDSESESTASCITSAVTESRWAA